ncbi:TIGR04222 domain-containing membrane protein [Embleya sp. MST-111070]|uniref:TIGR04222 domain-containing membrane protein n=1 Tax=Embleya sp. MST-111070 TaxID=3398231 RepID=UPI003F74166D
MNGTAWGLTGPEFLRLYGGIALGLVVLAIVLRIVLAWAVRGQARSGSLGPYDAAYLAGGPMRVADTALASLITEGYVHVQRVGRVTAATGSRPPEPVAAAMLDVVRTTRGTRLALLRGWSRTPMREQIERSLVERGLLHSPLARRIAKTPSRLLFVLGLVGIARFVNGLAHSRPIGFLVPMIVLTFVFAGLTAAGFRTTAAGRRELRELTSRLRADRRSGALVGAGALSGLFVVACLGMAAHPDPDARLALVAYGGSGSSGGGGGDGGSSCSGGSSCGGGCGGGGCGG